MNKIKQFFGIDISKDVFDVVDHADNHYQYKNDSSGFKEFYKILTEQSHCVMEVTGSYYQTLAIAKSGLYYYDEDFRSVYLNNV
jgi:transposase